VHSELLSKYLRARYPRLYLVSSTTKVLTEFEEFRRELDREEFSYVVADFRLNTAIQRLQSLTEKQRGKTELLCNECCYYGCRDRRLCYEAVSRRSLGEDCVHICAAPDAEKGYRFSEAMRNPAFIGVREIREIYAPAGFTEFKIEGRSLGSAVVLEFLLYYMTRPEYALKVREEIYLDSMLDLF